MIIKKVKIEKFRAFDNVEFCLGRHITAISGRNATQKTTVLGMISQPFSISRNHPMRGCSTIDGYNFRSQFKEKFKLSPIFDKSGEHRWTLYLHNNIYEHDHYTVASIDRHEKGRPSSLRFWNAESRAKGAGYIQIPVYYLSLSRLFPIGEAGKTHIHPLTLTDDEVKYCLKSYRRILSIQDSGGIARVDFEKSTNSRAFAGVKDAVHDLLANSAGEGNVMRILLAVLSFKRLMEAYKKDYKGGILLIDEVDATLYPFSQKQLVEYLLEAAKDYRIQIIFTTHSPIVLEQVNEFQRDEKKDKGINLPPDAYNSSIVYLFPNYDEEGRRFIMSKNISNKNELSDALSGINLSASVSQYKVNIYCEDQCAIDFVQFVLHQKMTVNLEQFMSFVAINLGWTNYVQLTSKSVPEFVRNMIVLDHDVLSKHEYKVKKHEIESFKNYLFLPLTVEKDFFILLKDHAAFSRFQRRIPQGCHLDFDICFNKWTETYDKYKTDDYKAWYKQTVSALGNQEILFSFWCEEFPAAVNTLVVDFVNRYNYLADGIGSDPLPLPEYGEDSL